MKINLFHFAFILCFPLSLMADGGLEFHPSVPSEEGMTAAFVTFKDGTHVVKYCVPANWDFSGDVFRPKGKMMAEARLQTFPIPAAIAWDKDHQEKVQEWLLSRYIPKDATNVTVISDELNALKICGNDTYSVVISYNLFGAQQQAGIVVVEREKTRFCFLIESMKSDFKNLFSTFRGSLFSVDGI